jgi:glycosyltransferase Alg8
VSPFPLHLSATQKNADLTQWLYALILYTAIVVWCVVFVSTGPGSIPYTALVTMGFVGIWRYSWLALHAVRALVYLRGHFPLYRQAADGYRKNLSRAHYPSVGIIIPSYKMDPAIFDRVFSSLLAEAYHYPGSVVIIAAVTTPKEITWIHNRLSVYAKRKDTLLWEIFLQDGTGKRSAMAESLTRLKPHGPLDRVILMDGDTVIQPKTLERLVGFFESQPDLGAITLDNRPLCLGNYPGIQAWYSLRMIQRHWLMASMSVSRRVLVLTGRFSMFRGEVALQEGFLQAIAADSLNHWRHGRLAMVTGDDKSTWFYTLKQGLAMLYIPDISCDTMEDPVSPHFFTNARLLMTRWFGNMVRNSDRAIALGPRNMPFFVWWCLVDQRLSTWTAMIGPVGALFLALIYHSALIPLYLLWVLITRSLWSGILTWVRGPFHPYFPALLFFGQVYGAMVKIHVMFRLHRQRWTRQMSAGTQETKEQRWAGIVLETASYGMFLFVMAVALGFLVVRL